MTTSRLARRPAWAAALLLVALAAGAPIQLRSDRPAPGIAIAAPGALAAQSYRVYMPLIRGSRGLPDLVVSQVELMPATPRAGRPVVAQISIRNAGGADITAPFWVELYVDPARPPQVNQCWPELSKLGAAWRVPPLLAGETRVIDTSATGDPDRPGEPYANFAAFDTPGEHRLFVLVDSYAPDRADGAVPEGEGEYNLFGPFTVRVAE